MKQTYRLACGCKILLIAALAACSGPQETANETASSSSGTTGSGGAASSTTGTPASSGAGQGGGTTVATGSAGSAVGGAGGAGGSGGLSGSAGTGGAGGIGGAGGMNAAGLTPPAWVALVRGASGLTSPAVAVQPDGTVVAIAANGSGMLTFGSGEPNELSVINPYQPGIGWYDAADGHLVLAQQIGGPVSMSLPGHVAARALATGADGGVFVTGELVNHALFFPNTSWAQQLDAVTTLNGSTLDRAEDPYVLRYNADRTPGWISRGRTPGPLSFTWFNYSTGVAVAPGGSVFTCGDSEASGLVIGYGKPNATTFTKGNGTYFASWASDGQLAWLVQNSGYFGIWQGIEASADGGAFLVGTAGSPVTLAAGSADQVVITPASGVGTHVVIKITASGSIAWVRIVEVPLSSQLNGFTVDTAGGVVFASSLKAGTVSFKDGNGSIVFTSMVPAEQGFLARYASDGTFSWAKLLGDSVDSISAITADTGQTIRAICRLVPGASQLELDQGGPVLLPALPGEGTAIVALDGMGSRTKATLVGYDLGIQSVWPSPDGALALSGLIHPMTNPTVGSSNGPTALPVPTMAEGGIAVVLKIVP